MDPVTLGRATCAAPGCSLGTGATFPHSGPASRVDAASRALSWRPLIMSFEFLLLFPPLSASFFCPACSHHATTLGHTTWPQRLQEATVTLSHQQPGDEGASLGTGGAQFPSHTSASSLTFSFSPILVPWQWGPTGNKPVSLAALCPLAWLGLHD